MLCAAACAQSMHPPAHCTTAHLLCSLPPPAAHPGQSDGPHGVAHPHPHAHTGRPRRAAVQHHTPPAVSAALPSPPQLSVPLHKGLPPALLALLQQPTTLAHAYALHLIATPKITPPDSLHDFICIQCPRSPVRRFNLWSPVIMVPAGPVIRSPFLAYLPTPMLPSQLSCPAEQSHCCQLNSACCHHKRKRCKR